MPATITTGIDKLVHQNERRADSVANLVRALEVDGSVPRFPEVAAAKAALESNETDEIAAELKLSIEEATQDGFSRSTLTSIKWMDSQICKTSGKGWATTRARLLLGYNSMTTALTMVSIFFPDVRFSRSEPGQPMTTLEWCLAARTYAKTGWRAARAWSAPRGADDRVPPHSAVDEALGPGRAHHAEQIHYAGPAARAPTSGARWPVRRRSRAD